MTVPGDIGVVTPQERGISEAMPRLRRPNGTRITENEVVVGASRGFE